MATPSRLEDIMAESERLQKELDRLSAFAPKAEQAVAPVAAPTPAPAAALPPVPTPAPVAVPVPASRPMPAPTALPEYTRAKAAPAMSVRQEPLTRQEILKIPGGEYALRKADVEAKRQYETKLPEMVTTPIPLPVDAKAIEAELASRKVAFEEAQKRADQLNAQVTYGEGLTGGPSRADLDAAQSAAEKARAEYGVTRYLAKIGPNAPKEYRAFSDQEIQKGEELYEKTQDPRLLPVLQAQQERRAGLYALGEKEAGAIAANLAVPFDQQKIAIGFGSDGKLVVDSAQYEAPIFLKERENIAREMGFSSYSTVPQEFEVAFKDARLPDATPESVQEKITIEAAAKAKATVQKAFQRSRNLTLYDPDPEGTTLRLAALPANIREVAAVFTPMAARTQSPVATDFMPERPGMGFLRMLGLFTSPFVARLQAFSESERPETVTRGLSTKEAQRLAESPILGLPRAAISMVANDPVGVVEGQLSTTALLLGGRTENIDEAAKVVAEVRKDRIFAQYLANQAEKAYDAAVKGKGNDDVRAALGLTFGAMGFVGLDMAAPDPVGLSLLGASMGIRSTASVSRQMERIGAVTREAAKADTFDDAVKGITIESPSAATLATQMVAVDSMFNAQVKGAVSEAGRRAAEAQTRLDALVVEAEKKGLIQGGEIQDVALAREAQAIQQQVYAAQLEASTGQVELLKDALTNFDTVSAPTLRIIDSNVRTYKKAAATLDAEKANLASLETTNKAVYDRADGLFAAEGKAGDDVIAARSAYEAAVTAKQNALTTLADEVTKAEAAVAAATDPGVRTAANGRLTAAKRALAAVKRAENPLNTAIVAARQARTAADTALVQAAEARKAYLGRAEVAGLWSARTKAVKKIDTLTGQMDALGSSLTAHGIDLNALDNVDTAVAFRKRLADDLKTARDQQRLLAKSAKEEAKKLPEIERVFKAAIDAEEMGERAQRWRGSLTRFADQVSEGGKKYEQVLDLYRTREGRFSDILGPAVADKATPALQREGIERIVRPTERGFLADALQGRVTEPEKVAQALLERNDDLGRLLVRIEKGTRAGETVPLTLKETTLLQQSLYDLSREVDLATQEDPFQLVRAVRIAEKADTSLRPRVFGRSAGNILPTVNARAFVPALASRFRAMAQGMDPIVAGTGIQVNDVIANVVRMSRNMSAQIDDEMMTFVRRADFSNLEPDTIRKVADLVNFDLAGRKLTDEALPGFLSGIQTKLRNRVVLGNEEANLVQAAAVVQYMDTTKGLVYPGGKTFINTLSDKTLWQRAREQMLRDPRMRKQLGLKPRLAAATGPLPPEKPPVVVPPTPVTPVERVVEEVTPAVAPPPATTTAPMSPEDVQRVVNETTARIHSGELSIPEAIAEMRRLGVSDTTPVPLPKEIAPPTPTTRFVPMEIRIGDRRLPVSGETVEAREQQLLEYLRGGQEPKPVPGAAAAEEVATAPALTGAIPAGVRARVETAVPGITPKPNAGVIEAPPASKLDPDSPKVMDPNHHPPDDIGEIPPPPPGLVGKADDGLRATDEATEVADETDFSLGEEPPTGELPVAGEGEVPSPEPAIPGEGYVEPEAFRALSRAWFPPSYEAKLDPTLAASIERRAYRLLSKNEKEGGDFFSFMKDLQQLTYGGRLPAEGKPPSGFFKTDDRYARVFGFAGRSAAHAAVLKSADDAFALGTMPFSREQLQGAISVLNGDYRNTKDFVRALRVFNSMGQPATITTAIRGSALDGALKNTVGLLRMAENPSGADVWTTTFTLQELESNIPKVLKELDARSVQARTPIGAIGERAYRSMISAWKTSAVTGLLLPNPRYYLNNIVGDFSQMWFEMGVYQATKQSFTNLPAQIPLVGNATQTMLSKFSERMGGVPVLGSVTNALFNPYLARVWDGSKGAIRLKNGAVATYDDFRKWLVEDGILDTFVHEELLSAFSEVTPSLWSRTFGGWQRHMEQHANFVQQRQRSGLYLDLIRQGYTRPEAKRLTLNALYDWKNGIAKGELQGLASNIAFYRFWRLALGQFNRALMEPLTTATPGRYLQQAMTGQTQFGRLRQMYQAADKIVAPALQQSEEEAQTPRENLDEMARAIYPTWMVGRGPTFSKRLDDEARRQFQVTQGRFVSDAAITLPRLTPFDIVAQYSAFITPIIGGAAEYIGGAQNVTPDYGRTSVKTLIEQFNPFVRMGAEAALGFDERTSKGDVRITPAEALVLDKFPLASTPHRDPETGELRAGAGEAAFLRLMPFIGLQLTKNVDNALTDNPNALVAYDRAQKIAQLKAAAQLETDQDKRQKFAQAAAVLDAQQGDTIEDAAAWFFMRSLGVGPYPYSVEQINTSLGRSISEDLKAQGKMAEMTPFEGYIYGEGQPVPAERIMEEVLGPD